MIYLIIATGLSPGGSSTVHIYTQTVHRTTQITTNLEECGPCPVFASFTLVFATQLRKKHGKNLSQGKKNLRVRKTLVMATNPSFRVRKTSFRVRKTSFRVRKTSDRLRKTSFRVKKHLSQGKKNLIQGKKNLRQVKKNLIQG